MLFDYSFLIPDFDSTFFKDSHASPINMAIPINQTITGDPLHVFQTLFAAKAGISFYLPEDLLQTNQTILRETVIENIVRLLFLPNYRKNEGRHIIFTSQVSEDNEDFSKLKELFSTELGKQGIRIDYSEIRQQLPAGNEPAGNNSISLHPPALDNFLLSDADTGSLNDLDQQYDLSDLIDKKVTVPVLSPGDLRNKIKKLEVFEHWLTTEHPKKTGLMQNYKASLQHCSELNAENDLLRFKLANGVSYLELIKREGELHVNHIRHIEAHNHMLQQIIKNNGQAVPSMPVLSDNSASIIHLEMQVAAQKKRADETLNWYLKEYEALPMWYKRGGQLLKVLMGKRTFKSLFDK